MQFELKRRKTFGVTDYTNWVPQKLWNDRRTDGVDPLPYLLSLKRRRLKMRFFKVSKKKESIICVRMG